MTLAECIAGADALLADRAEQVARVFAAGRPPDRGGATITRGREGAVAREIRKHGVDTAPRGEIA